MSSAKWYASAAGAMASGSIKIGTNAIKCAMFKSTHTPNYLTDTLYSSLANETTGTNYTAGGVTLTSVADTVTPANSYATVAAINTVYAVGQVVRPSVANGNLYMCVVAGTSAGSAPVYPTTFGGTVVDGTVTWLCCGTAIMQFTGTVPTFTALTTTDYRYLVFYDSVTSALICCHDTGAQQVVGTPTNVTYTPDATGIAYDLVA